MTSSSLIPSDSLRDKVALVTGAASGIGAASARRLSAGGAKVALLDWNAERLGMVAAELGGVGQNVLALTADISDPAAMAQVFADVVAAWGRLDIVVANAGVNGVWAPLDEITPEEWDHTQAVNLRGAFLTMRGAIPMLRARGGSVVVISSVNGSRTFCNIGASAYACAKAGQVALAKMAAVELGPDRIRVNVICPGAVSTDIERSTERRNLEQFRQPSADHPDRIPLTGGEPASPERVADLVWFLASDLSAHISGTEIFLDGAESLARL